MTTEDGIYLAVLDSNAVLHWRIYGVNKRGVHWHIGNVVGIHRTADSEGLRLANKGGFVSYYLVGK